MKFILTAEFDDDRRDMRMQQLSSSVDLRCATSEHSSVSRLDRVGWTILHMCPFGSLSRPVACRCRISTPFLFRVVVAEHSRSTTSLVVLRRLHSSTPSVASPSSSVATELSFGRTERDNRHRSDSAIVVFVGRRRDSRPLDGILMFRDCTD